LENGQTDTPIIIPYFRGIILNYPANLQKRGVVRVKSSMQEYFLLGELATAVFTEIELGCSCIGFSFTIFPVSLAAACWAGYRFSF
jgi:hypothetical protein